MIVFCTTCKGRTQHLEQTLPKNIEDNKYCPDHKFVVLNYNSQDHLLAYITENHSNDIDSGKLSVYTYRDASIFHMAHAKNMAHRLGILEGGDVLVNVDADNFTGPCFADYVHRKFQEPNVFLWSRMIKEGPNKLPRGISGRIAVTKDAFLKVGGYDEKFSTWSPDDKDFNIRLRNLHYAAHEIDNRYLSGVLHSDKMRFREYPHAETNQCSEQFDEVEFSSDTVVNYGNFGCGVVTKNFTTGVTVLEPVPTRIFGIGMHKTGTTSLNEALVILGLDSAHWRSAHWAKAIWNEMKTYGRSITLEKHYALSDLPITLLYKELDIAYPGSKFILTTRNEDKWLESVRNHWLPEKNTFRPSWDSDPFSHKVHKELYGRKNFDAEVFLERFRRYNAEVLEYFKGRKGRLLVIDLDKNPSWDGLCQFLNKPIPNVEYPKRFQTPVEKE